MYEPLHTRLSLAPCDPYLATSNISPNNKVNKSCNSHCSEKRTFHLFWRAHMANRQSSLHADIIKGMKASMAWRQKGSDRWKQYAACDLNRSVWWTKDEKRNFQAMKRGRNRSRIMLREKPLWQESELKAQRQYLCKSRMI